MKINSGFPRTSAASALAVLAIGLVGCGGGGGGHHGASKSRTGSLRFTVAWPEQISRVIPANAQSLKVEVWQGGSMINSNLIVRPNNAVSFPELPVGAVTVKAFAYAAADGTGNALASASVPTTIVENTVVNLDVNLASTIDHLAVTPSPFRVGATQIANIEVVAYDAGGSIVLTSPSSLSFSSANGSVATVGADGKVTGGSLVGSTTITINDADSGKSLSLPLNVVPFVSISASASSLTLRGTATLTATVVGTSNAGVTWSIVEGASGGTVSAAGLYTAPATKGTYHIVATSAADPLSKAVIPIKISSGSLGVVVH